MGRMGDRVTLSRGERRWMRGEGREGWMGRWMDGKTAKRREREKNFVRRKQASFEREREREEHHFSKSPAGKMLIISRCFLRVKMHAKKGRPLSRSIFIRSPSTLSSITPCTHRDALWPGLNVFSFSLSLFRPLLCFFFSFSFFLDRHRWIKFSFIFVGFLWGKGFEVAYDPIFGFVKSGLVCALEIYEEETSRWTQVFATRSC